MAWLRMRFFAGAIGMAALSVSALPRPVDKISEGFEKTAESVRIHYLQSGPVASPRALVLIPGWRLPA
jgi:hypothetical protein